MNVVTRFAPSPTGYMHFGNLRTALFNYLFALKMQGRFLLRIEDTDIERSKLEYSTALQEELEIFGLKPSEEPVWQSQRSEIYEQYYQRLADQDAIYPCFCQPEELKRIRKMQLMSGQPPRYPGTCRNLTAQERAVKSAQYKPAWRFRVADEAEIKFTDLFKGPQKFLGRDIGDFIVRKQQGIPAFMFANAIDDALLGITHALRGDDHLPNTALQILLLQTLKMRIPEYGHFPMIVSQDGSKLSKRDGSAAVGDWRLAGYHPRAILNYLARLGHYYSDNSLLSLEQMASQFAAQSVNQAPAKHDLTHLTYWQKETMHHLTAADRASYLKPILERVPLEQQDAFLALLQANITMPADLKEWETLFDPTLVFDKPAKDLLQQAGPDFFEKALAVLRPGISYVDWLAELKQATQVNGKKLFMPIRIALSGKTAGPILPDLFTLLGEQRVRQRCQQVYDDLTQTKSS